MASKSDHAVLQHFDNEATAVGEVVSIDGGQLVIAGDFSPGLGTYELRPGARVFILNEHDAIASSPTGVDL